jgi:hypothetical protein
MPGDGNSAHRPSHASALTCPGRVEPAWRAFSNSGEREPFVSADAALAPLAAAPARSDACAGRRIAAFRALPLRAMASANMLLRAPSTLSPIAALPSEGVVLDDRRLAPRRKTADAR